MSITTWKTMQRLLSKLDTQPMYLVLEKRPSRFMFGCRNYGDIPKFINPADGDPWDVIVPCVKKLPMNKKLRIRNLLGVVLMKNGNHKLAVSVYNHSTKTDFTKRILNKYSRLYRNKTKIDNIVRIV